MVILGCSAPKQSLCTCVAADGGVEADDAITPSDQASLKPQSEEAARQKADERNRFHCNWLCQLNVEVSPCCPSQ